MYVKDNDETWYLVCLKRKLSILKTSLRLNQFTGLLSHPETSPEDTKKKA